MQAENKKMSWYKPIKAMVNSFFASLTCFFALFLILSAYSDYVSPNKNILFAYTGLIFPLLLIVNGLFLVYWLIARKWRWVVMLAVTCAICWKPITHFCPLHFKTKELPQEGMIKMLSFNVMSFAYKDHTQKDPNKIIQYIAESGADLVCLQEYMVSARSNLMSSKDLKEALPEYPYIAEIFFTSLKNANYKYGLAVLSKFPIVSSRQIHFPSIYNGASIHEINVRGRKITLINAHLESFKLTAEDRSKYSDMITNVSLETFDEFRDVLQQKLGQAFRTRAKQVEVIANEIRKTNNQDIIVCGDFNDTPISYSHRVMQGSLLDAYAETGLGMGISYNQNYFYFRIDHIFHSSTMKAYNCRVDTRINLSDHYPISCYLELQ